MSRRQINIGIIIVSIIVIGGVYLITEVLAAQTTIAVLNSRLPYRKQPVDFYTLLRSSAILTTSYVDTAYADLKGASDVGLHFQLTKGSLTSFQYKVLWSPDGVNWYDECTEAVAASVVTDTLLYYTTTLSENVNYYKPLPFRSGYAKVKVKGTGTVTSSACLVAMTGRYY